MFKYVLYFLSLALPAGIYAQDFNPAADWNFQNFNHQNHFTSRNINNLAVDKHGYVWTCSLGVQRFDGFRTIDYNSLDPSAGGLKSNYTDLLSDSSGRVWVSAGGLCYYDEVQNRFVYPDSAQSQHITYAYALCRHKQYIWFFCDHGLAKIDLRTLKISYTALGVISNPICTSPVNDSTLLISTRTWVYFYNIKQNTYSRKIWLRNNAIVKTFSVKQLGGNIYLGTNFGLFLFKGPDSISLCAATKKLFINDISLGPMGDKSKYLFIATDGTGLVVYNIVSGKIEQTFLHDNNNPFSLAANLVTRLYVDSRRRLWLCTSDGISMIDPTDQKWKIRFLDYQNTSNLTVTRIARDRFDTGKMWMTCTNWGLLCVDWKTKQIERKYNINPDTRKLYDLRQLSKTRWLLTTTKYIIEWDENKGTLYSTGLPIPDSVRLVYNIRGILAAGQSIYITSDRGLFRYDTGTHRASPVLGAVPPAGERDLEKFDFISGFSENDKIWLASRDGLFCYDISTGTAQCFRGQGDRSDYFFFDAARVNDHVIFCGSMTGINVFDERTQRFSPLHYIANLNRPSCVRFIRMKNLLWIATNEWIIYYDFGRHAFSNIGYQNYRQIAAPASAFTEANQEIVFGIQNGYASFSPGLAHNPAPSNPVIEAVEVNNKPILPYYPAEEHKREFVFSHAENSVNIAFTALLFSDPDDIRFRYRLKGADKEWRPAGDERNANFAQLEPGAYTFYLQSGNKNGGWNDHIASFGFTILPPYWETWWFRSLVLIAVAILLYRLYRYRINNLLAIQKIRERIASDFHDDIGSALSSISIFSEVADAQLEEKLPHEETREVVGHITLHARGMLDAMDDIVWAVNPKNDHFNDLAVRMREFAIPLLEAKGIRFDIDIDENILATRIKMEVRKNIFMIFKECVNNLLKHSACTEANVKVIKDGDSIEIIISDNGKGFDINAETNRNGLKNMQKRAAEINGTFQVKTAAGEGTVTMLTVNTV